VHGVHASERDGNVAGRERRGQRKVEEEEEGGGKGARQMTARYEMSEWVKERRKKMDFKHFCFDYYCSCSSQNFAK